MGKVVVLCTAQTQAGFAWTTGGGGGRAGRGGSLQGRGCDVEIGQPAQGSWGMQWSEKDAVCQAEIPLPGAKLKVTEEFAGG